ncbi:guanine nucleotide binding protein, alpha subunit [Chytriomyces sp. MP71]|nr:guanine nucleotide binding protein, alpha subunit [Chytriomyces sp. MP71]
MCFKSTSPEDASAHLTSKRIDAMIHEEMKREKESVKLLLLGPGETGKSTILKQIKLIYGAGFEAEERKFLRSAVLSNVIQCIKTLAQNMDHLRIPFGFKWINSDAGDDSCQETSGDVPHSTPNTLNRMVDKLTPDEANSTYIKESAITLEGGKVSDSSVATLAPKNPLALRAELEYASQGRKQNRSKISNAAKLVKRNVVMLLTSDGFVLDEEYIKAVKLLWSDPGIQYCFSRSSEYQLLDCCAYYLNEIDRIGQPDYVPTDQDILFARITTSTITETKVYIDNILFKIFDVGGQRSERKRWAPYFDNVKAIVYVAAISAYDQTCMEDNKTNRITEAVTLFDSIVNHPIFKSTPILLFLNKIDMFKKKVDKVPISNYFPKFEGANESSAGKEYFARLFLSRNKYQERRVYVHFTWATDTKQIRRVLETVYQIILKQNLGIAGISLE